jgi:VanZ family protein
MRAIDWSLWLLAALVAALLVFPLPIDLGPRRFPALASELEDLAHPVAFGVLAYLAFARLRRRWPVPAAGPHVWVILGAVLFGLLTEAVQSVTGRDSSWKDFAGDMLGAIVALLLHARAEQPLAARRLALGAGALLATVAAISPLGLTLVAYAHRALHAPVLWQDGSPMFSRFTRWHDGRYAALLLEEPAPDWRKWTFLEVDLETTRTRPLRVVVRVHDRQHDQRHEDRYNEAFMLQPLQRTLLRIPLERIRSGPRDRNLDMSDIAGVVVFAPAADPAGDLVVHAIRLSR